jgi:hypothetical protein
VDLVWNPRQVLDAVQHRRRRRVHQRRVPAGNDAPVWQSDGGAARYPLVPLAAGLGPRFCFYVHHTDDKREWAYDRKSVIGHFDKGLDEASVQGWTVVSMKDDWNKIFAFEK